MASRGDFIWEELLTTDTAAATRFYARVADLKASPSAVHPGYTTLAGSGGPMGGLMAQPDEARNMGAPPCWMTYVATDDVEETSRHAESLGGRVLKPPADVGDGGRFAVLQDPQGAAFMVYASPHPIQPATTVPLGGVYWHELITTDYEAAFRFYEPLFGWKIARDMNTDGAGVYRVFGTPNMPNGAGGMYTKAAGQPGPPAWLPYLHVASAEKAAATAVALGARIMHGPADAPGGRIAIGLDPQGAMFAVYALAKAAAPAPRSTTRRVVEKRPSRRKAAAPRKPARAATRSAKRAVAKKTKRKAGAKK